jgi:hypothetical protein
LTEISQAYIRYAAAPLPPGGCAGTYLCAKDEPRDDTVCAYADT